VPGGLFKSPNLEAYTTAMNVSQCEGLGADGIMANDSYQSRPGSKTILMHHTSMPLFLIVEELSGRAAVAVAYCGQQGGKSCYLDHLTSV
jgi:hypothetical protein